MEEKKESIKPRKEPRYLRNASIQLLTHPVDQNIAWSFLASVAFAAVSVLTGFPLALLLGVLVGAALTLRRVLSARGSAPARAHEALWLREEGGAAPPHVGHALLFVERGLSVGALRELVRTRVLERFPRFRQRAVRGAGGYAWAEARNFALEEHVFEESARGELRPLVDALMREPLPRARPLWELRLLTPDADGEAVLVARVHQALSDAAALVALLCDHLADSPPRARPRPRFGAATFLLNAFRAVFVAPLTFLGWLLCRPRDYNFFSRGHRPGARCVAWHAPGLRLAKVQRIKQVMRCSLNDVFVSAASGAVRAYFTKNGIRNPPNVTLSLPVDLRSPEEVDRCVGCSFAQVGVRLPSGVEGAVPRLWEVRRRMEELKASPDTAVMWAAVATLLPLLPEPLAHWIIRAVLRKATVLLSNVPGPEEALRVGGRRLRRILFWMPSADTPVAFSLISYAGAVHLSVSADSTVVQHPHLLVTEFVNELRRLSHLLARRRIPGEHRRRSHFTDERRLAEIINPPDGELQHKLHLVQEEIHCLTQHLSEQPQLHERLEELKEEFSELMRELRRRKSIADGIAPDPTQDEEDMDGELRRPRRLTLSSSRRSSLMALASTTRPLATPTISHHAFVVSTPNLQQPESPTRRPPTLLQVTTQDRFGRRKSDFN